MTDVLKIDLSGCLTLVDQQGTSRTPRGQKTCGVVALLATAPKLKRARRWIQSKLWSDRGYDQANASLRQSLAELRKTLGPMATLLHADRKEVWVDPEAVRIVFPGDPDALNAAGEEFLSGIDIRDEAFEDWLREMRSSFADVPVQPSTHVRPQMPRTEQIVRLLLPDPAAPSEAPSLREWRRKRSQSTFANEPLQRLEQSRTALWPIVESPR